jgi:hypothetical protein
MRGQTSHGKGSTVRPFNRKVYDSSPFWDQIEELKKKELSMITIHNLRNEKPSEPYDVIVDRRSPLGNPFSMSDESQRDEVCDRYEGWFQDMLTMKPITPYNSPKVHSSFGVEILRLQETYKKHGKLRLFCWCTPKRCHAETIAKFVEEKEKQDE